MRRATILSIPAVCAALLGAVFGLHRIAEADLLHQVAVGRAILVDPSSYGTSSFVEAFPHYPYIEDKGLASVLVALVDAAAGIDGLMLYQVLVCAFVAIAWYAMLRAWDASPLAALVGVALGLVACSHRLEPRPDTLSLGLLLVLFTLVRGRLAWNTLRWTVPLTMALWINVHGYFVVGLCVLAAACAAALFGDVTLRDAHGSRRTAVQRRFALLGLGTAACLLHPQGWRALAWPIEQLLILRREPVLREAITELGPTSARFADLHAWHWTLLAVSAATVLAFAWPRMRMSALVRQSLALIAALPWLVAPPPGLESWPYRLTFALFLMAAFELPDALRRRCWFRPLVYFGLTALGVAMIRNTMLLPPAALALLAPAWTTAAAELCQLASAHLRSVRTLGAALACTLVAVPAWARLADRLTSGNPRAPGRTGWGLEEAHFPIGAAEFVAREGLAGPILNNFDAAGYLLYRLHPQWRVFVASNTSMYPASFLAYDRAQVVGRGDIDGARERYGVKTVVLDLAAQDTPNLIARLAASPDWSLVYLDRAGAVFVHAEDGTRVFVERTRVNLERRIAELARENHGTVPWLPIALGARQSSYPDLNLAIFLWEAGRPDLALVEADRLWERAPLEETALFAAQAAERAGMLPQRVPKLEEAARAFPHSTDVATALARALFARANAQIVRGAFADARRDLERSLALTPDSPRTALALAKLCVRDGDRDGAKRYLAIVLRDGADPKVRQMAEADPSLKAWIP